MRHAPTCGGLVSFGRAKRLELAVQACRDVLRSVRTHLRQARCRELPVVGHALDFLDRAPDPALGELEALVLVLDQFPRNLYRASARAFDFDPLALEAASGAIEAGFDRLLLPLWSSFFYLPFEHAENIEHQVCCVELFEELHARAPTELKASLQKSLDFARRHYEVIRRFGRFLHRNEVLGRNHTPEEQNYLAQSGDTF